jgi:NAD(P)-dependent dehydrogenase (short-subunit alcohol dehydrogenase family)
VSLNQKALIIGIDSSAVSDLLARLNHLGYEIHGTSRRQAGQGKGPWLTYHLDVSSVGSLQQAFAKISNQKFDVIISAIGVTSGIALENDAPKHVEHTIVVNLTSQLLMLPKLVDLTNENGIIIFFGSSAADGDSYDLTYSASKAGLRAAITSYLNTRVVGKKRIYVVEPSLIEESTMYNQMTEGNIARHRGKWNGLLVEKKGISKAIISLILDSKQNDPIQRIRPEELA